LLAAGHPEVRPDDGGRAHVPGGGGPTGTLPRGLRPPRHQRTEHQEVHTHTHQSTVRVEIAQQHTYTRDGRISLDHSCATISHPAYMPKLYIRDVCDGAAG
jgi:hypothetical protein